MSPRSDIVCRPSPPIVVFPGLAWGWSRCVGVQRSCVPIRFAWVEGRLLCPIWAATYCAPTRSSFRSYPDLPDGVASILSLKPCRPPISPPNSDGSGCRRRPLTARRALSPLVGGGSASSWATSSCGPRRLFAAFELRGKGPSVPGQGQGQAQGQAQDARCSCSSDSVTAPWPRQDGITKSGEGTRSIEGPSWSRIHLYATERSIPSDDLDFRDATRGGQRALPYSPYVG